MAICSLSVLIICSLSIVVSVCGGKIRTIAERRCPRRRLRRRKRLETPDSQMPDVGSSYTMQPTAAVSYTPFPPKRGDLIHGYLNPNFTPPLTHTSFGRRSLFAKATHVFIFLPSYCLTVLPSHCLTFLPATSLNDGGISAALRHAILRPTPFTLASHVSHVSRSDNGESCTYMISVIHGKAPINYLCTRLVRDRVDFGFKISYLATCQVLIRFKESDGEVR